MLLCCEVVIAPLANPSMLLFRLEVRLVSCTSLSKNVSPVDPFGASSAFGVGRLT